MTRLTLITQIFTNTSTRVISICQPVKIENDKNEERGINQYHPDQTSGKKYDEIKDI